VRVELRRNRQSNELGAADRAKIEGVKILNDDSRHKVAITLISFTNSARVQSQHQWHDTEMPAEREICRSSLGLRASEKVAA